MSGCSPVLELGNDPLTPREKVARLVDPEAFDHPTVHPQNLVARRAVSFSKADAILTALASGSGDHAELARLAEDLRGPWLSRVKQNKAADALESLLAENAALRDYGKSAAKEALEYRARATEAERKLAEAVRIFQKIETHHGIECIPDNEIQAEIRTFLSREAERG